MKYTTPIVLATLVITGCLLAANTLPSGSDTHGHFAGALHYEHETAAYHTESGMCLDAPLVFDEPGERLVRSTQHTVRLPLFWPFDDEGYDRALDHVLLSINDARKVPMVVRLDTGGVRTKVILTATANDGHAALEIDTVYNQPYVECDWHYPDQYGEWEHLGLVANEETARLRLNDGLIHWLAGYPGETFEARIQVETWVSCSGQGAVVFLGDAASGGDVLINKAWSYWFP